MIGGGFFLTDVGYHGTSTILSGGFMSIRFRIFILVKGKRNTISLPSKIGEHNKLLIQKYVETIRDALEMEVALDQLQVFGFRR